MQSVLFGGFGEVNSRSGGLDGFDCLFGWLAASVLVCIYCGFAGGLLFADLLLVPFESATLLRRPVQFSNILYGRRNATMLYTQRKVQAC